MTRTPGSRRASGAASGSRPRIGARLFLKRLQEAGLPAPIAEYKFWPGRKFAFDYAWPEFRVALEVEGGVFTRQAHGSISGVLRDMEKYSEAAARGWRIIRCLPRDLLSSRTLDYLTRALSP